MYDIKILGGKGGAGKGSLVDLSKAADTHQVISTGNLLRAAVISPLSASTTAMPVPRARLSLSLSPLWTSKIPSHAGRHFFCRPLFFILILTKLHLSHILFHMPHLQSHIYLYYYSKYNILHYSFHNLH